MSGICGIFRFDGGAVSSRNLERMARALAPRGLDGNKFLTDGPVGLGHCLMRVNREDLFEAQPLHDRGAAVTLVADLRLDNREQLAAAFGVGAAELRELPDSALVLRAYKTWGENCAEHLLGDFAFAIWDGGTKKLVLGRDHMGQRCVNYHLATDFFAFATDIKALWSYPDVPRVLSDAKIGSILIHDLSPSEGETPFDGIHGVPGATVMTIGADGTIRKRRYWQPRADSVHENRDEAYYVDAYRRVLGEAVACRLRRTIRTPGIVFSGGYDSAAIAGLAGPVLAGSGRKLIAAASVMPADYRGTIRHARRWVEMCARDMPHLEVRYVTREGKTVLSGLEQAFLDSEMPVGSYNFAMSELLSSLADAGAQVIMDGHGGDYTLHPRGQAALARFLATFQLRRFITELRGHLRLSGHSLWITLKNDIAALLLPASVMAPWKRLRHGSAPIWRDQPINPEFAKQLIEQRSINESNLRISAKPKLDMREQIAAALRRVTTGSAPGMAASAARHGLELTRPFHDKRVVELALAIPQDLYVKNGRSRYLACAALKDIYPPEFQNRWRKNDDEVPDFQRMAKSIEPQLLVDIARMAKSNKLAAYVDFAKIRHLLAARGPDDHNSGWEQETQLALHGYMVARYLQWFRRDNS
ncbi:MAG TPA: asparagine synthase-related protein [Xanthobacteraceae bacterium]|jgi:asparagine synthase (glutamine-hydrolysing)